LWMIGFFSFGFLVGEPAVRVLAFYSKFANYVAIALVVAVVVLTFMRSSRKG